jgi:hypothetical protein
VVWTRTSSTVHVDVPVRKSMCLALLAMLMH